MSVGVMKDYKLKQRDLRASHTLDKLKGDPGSIVTPETRVLAKRGRHQRTVSLVLVVSQQETVGLVRRSRNQST
jgi:hypothetical protein